MNPKDLNRAIKRQQFHIPTTQDVLIHLSDMKVFTKLDQKDSYQQIPLDEKCQELTTSNTPFDQYCFVVLSFGFKATSEVLQKRNYQVFGDIFAVHTIADDVSEALLLKLTRNIIRKVMDRAQKMHVRSYIVTTATIPCYMGVSYTCLLFYKRHSTGRNPYILLIYLYPITDMHITIAMSFPHCP